MTDIRPSPPNGNSSVLLIDSDPGFVAQSCQLIAEAGHRAWGAQDLIAAANLLADQAPDLLLVEVALLEMDGADPLGDLRARAPGAPVVLLASGPPDDRFRRFFKAHEIFGYHDKQHGSDGLRLWVNAAFGAISQEEIIRINRAELRQVLDAIPQLHRIQSLDDVLKAILDQVDGLIGGDGAFVAARMSDPIGKPLARGLAREDHDTDDYVVGATSHNRYPIGSNVDDLASVPSKLLRQAIQDGTHQQGDDDAVLPLALAEHVLGLAYLKHPVQGRRDADVLRVYASQAAAAIRSAALYELATIDATTRAYRKAFTLERLNESLKLAWRKSFPISVVMADIDEFKNVNDRYGHIAGDRALRYVANLLRRNVRDSDVVGRFGGDEFLIVLMDSTAEGAHTVVQRIYSSLGRQSGRSSLDSLPPLTLSMGIASIGPRAEPVPQIGVPDYGKAVEQLVSGADAMMIRARTEPDYDFSTPEFNWKDFARK
jgi:two-component system cell cycle response regulator